MENRHRPSFALAVATLIASAGGGALLAEETGSQPGSPAPLTGPLELPFTFDGPPPPCRRPW